jgi:acetyl esterase/lipase
MTTLFLFLSLLFGWLAYNLYHPIYRHPLLSMFSFLSGWLTGELALHHILWQVLLVILFVWGGAVEGFLGALGLLICITSWFTMAYFYVQGNEARDEMESALLSGLGADFQGRINDEFRTHFPLMPDFGAIKRPFARIDPMIEVVKDIPFGQHKQALDIYRARNSVAGRPVLFQIHGGAWTEKMGSKNEQGIPLMSHMAKRDWICVASSYRLSPEATFPEHIIDCKEAVVWIKDHISEYGGDPNFIVVTGGSAGGHLSSLMALTANDPDFQPGFEDKDTSLQGAVPFYGVYDFTNKHQLQKHDGLRNWFETSIMKLSFEGNEEEYEQASPLFRLHKDAPPFLIIHGDKDTLVPVEEARVFSENLRAVSSNSVSYAEISGAQHGFDIFPSLRSEHVKQGIEKFLCLLYSDYLISSSDSLEAPSKVDDEQ